MFNSGVTGYSLSDIAAATGNNGNNSGMGWGGDWSAWIIIFLIFAPAHAVIVAIVASSGSNVSKRIIAGNAHS